MTSIKFFLSLIFLLIICQASAQNKIVIIGEAANFKIGATVISSEDGAFYILDGLDYWDKKIIGKTIKVWGKLKVEKIKKQSQEPGLPIPQQLVGKFKRTILNPKWQLVNR